MSAQEDWEAAKKRRDMAAYLIAKSYLAGTLDTFAAKEAEKFAAADAEMERIEKELTGRADK